VIRIEEGNIPARGISAAQWGWRVNDATQTPIADAIGLSQVMQRVGGFTVGSGQTTSSTTYVAVTSSLVTFSLARQSRILTFYQMGNGLTGADTFGQANLKVDGVFQGADMLFQRPNAADVNGLMTVMMWDSLVLAAGSHTTQLFMRVGN